jgi:hypothetical protein
MVWVQLTVQTNQHIEHGCHISETGGEMSRCPVKHLLGLADDSQQREGRFDHHAIISGAFETEFEGVWHTAFTSEAHICQHNPVFLD